ncbi:hypothetical protein [Mycetohabitans rhizoxinica]|uniref:hypothetical protein n=1 Tax=Mycetohabitans rhizoxinica TaxID=412963 RepID=UPI0030D422BB
MDLLLAQHARSMSYAPSGLVRATLEAAWQRTRWAVRGTGEMLKRRLYQIAVGIPLPDPAAVLFDLDSAIEGRPARGRAIVESAKCHHRSR